MWLGAGLILAIWILLIAVLLVNLIEWPVKKIINRSANALNEATPRLESATKDIINLQKQIRNINEVVLLEDFESLQKKFMEVTELIGHSHKLELRIVGTMLGTYGKASLSLADQLVSISEKQLPFKEAFFCVPGHKPGSRGGTSRRSLYPFSARISVGKILIALSKAVKEHSIGLNPDGL